MNKDKLDYLWNKHKLLDPDYIVEVLRIDTAELMEAFSTRFVEYLSDNFEEEEDEQDEEGSLYGPYTE